MRQLMSDLSGRSSGFASVYLAHDETAHTVSRHISGTMLRDDARFIGRRIEKFAEENCSAGAMPLAEWNGLTDWLVVGMNWHVQCLLNLGQVKEQLPMPVEPGFAFPVPL